MRTAQTPRTQAQRTAEMRDRVLDATVEVLLEDGYAATTLRAVAARAGVSSGAMTHHFPARLDLVAAAVERLVDERVLTLQRSLQALSGDRTEWAAASLELLRADFEGPLFTAFVKVWVAAVDDTDLNARLIPHERRVAQVIAAAIADTPVRLRRPDTEARIYAAVCAVRGYALAERFEPGLPPGDERWRRIRPVLIALLSGD